MSRHHVHKFGGSSLADADGYRRVTQTMLRIGQPHDCIVVSASGQTTNTLYTLLSLYDDAKPWIELLQKLYYQQLSLIQALLPSNYEQEIVQQLQSDLQTLKQLLNAKELDVYERANLISFGEVWSARLLAAHLSHMQVPTRFIDARSFLTAQHHATPVILEEVSQSKLMHMKQQYPHTRFIITGFICSTTQGKTLLLGRNGSDYSATLIARLLRAEQVHIWTDVTGIYNADPHRVHDAQKLASLSLAEADRLARLGCPVLHERSLQPLQGLETQMTVRSSFEPDSDYSIITPTSSEASQPILTSMAQVILFKLITNLAAEELLRQLRIHSIEVLAYWQSYQGTLELAITQEHQHNVMLHLSQHQQEYTIESITVDDQFGLIGLVSTQAEQYVKTYSRFLSRMAKPLYQDAYSLVTLLPCHQVKTTMQKIHQACAAPQKKVGLILFGLETQGQLWIQYLLEKQADLEMHLGVSLHHIALADARNIWLDMQGISLHDHWQEQFQQCQQPWNQDKLIEQLNQSEYDEIIFIDTLDQAQLLPYYPEAFAHGLHVISTHNTSVAPTLPLYRHLQQNLTKKRVFWRYNLSISLAYPVPSLLYALQADTTQDIQIRLQGSALNTLFSDATDQTCSALLQSYETEHAIRDELSGRTMQRSLVIIARELGFEIEQSDVELEPLCPVIDITAPHLNSTQHCTDFDQWFKEKKRDAPDGMQWSYLGSLTLRQGQIHAKVACTLLDKNEFFCQLQAHEHGFELKNNSTYSQPFFVKGNADPHSSFVHAIMRELAYISKQTLTN